MKTKTKLTLGVGLLFILIIFLSVIGAFNINAIKNDTENILKANYNSLQYCRNIFIAIENYSDENLKKFEENLSNQELNITEIGEADFTQKLRNNFEEYKANPSNLELSKSIRNNLYQIMEMNMQAISRKSELAKVTADKAVFWIVLSGTLCFLIAFILLVNLPSNIANPIKELTESIKQIAAKNYSNRVHFESHSEFGQLAMSFNTMAEKLEEYNNSNLAKLMMEKKRIETLINNMNDPVIGLDENLKIIFANEEAIKITGINSAEMIGKLTPELAKTNDLIKSLINDLELYEANSNNKKIHIKIIRENKECYFEKEVLHIFVKPTGEENQKLVGHFIFLRNVTSYKELDVAKTNFIATVSHEFKTPISSIKLSLQLLENNKIGTLNEEQNNLIESIKDDTNRLLKITGELLNLTQVESGNIQLSILPVDPLEILQYAINATKTQAEQKQIVIKVVNSGLLEKVYADSEKTAWVLINLISNAILYSYHNSTIELCVEQKNDIISFTVKDSGQGIAPQYKDKIFDRYFRVPGTMKEGTGLGLAISKEFIEAQGGKISMESEYGSGSSFIIQLNKAI